MINSYFAYLVQASIGIVLVSLTYKLLFEKLTFFRWNRVYLLVGLVICLILPVISLPASWQVMTPGQKVLDTGFYKWVVSPFPSQHGVTSGDQPGKSNINWLEIAVWILGTVYLAGAIVKGRQFIVNLRSVSLLKKVAFKFREEDNCSIYVQSALPTFSFGRYIFLHRITEELSENELSQVLLHEKTHVRQHHTFDILFLEILGVVFWFNPCLAYLSGSMRQVHEYLVDAHVTYSSYSRINYGRLLVKLAAQQMGSPVVNTFSDTQIYRRIQMLTKPKSNPMQKLKFLTVIPLLAVILLQCAFLNEQNPSASAVHTDQHGTVQDQVIGSITWTGNTKYTSSELAKSFTLKTGDAFDPKQLQEEQYGMGLAGLYMDHGYLFFRIETTKKVTGKTVDLTMHIYEGPLSVNRNIVIKGNKKISTEAILAMIEAKPGELFSRTKVLNSQKNLSKMGAFVPNQININPLPDQEALESGKVVPVDWEFVVTEL